MSRFWNILKYLLGQFGIILTVGTLVIVGVNVFNSRTEWYDGFLGIVTVGSALWWGGYINKT